MDMRRRRHLAAGALFIELFGQRPYLRVRRWPFGRFHPESCMARDVVDAEMIESRDDLVAWLAAGGKPAESFRIGVEHEKFPFYTADARPVNRSAGRTIQ